MLPPPTKHFSTRAVDALASAAGAGALRGGDFAEAFFLWLPLDFFALRGFDFAIVAGVYDDTT